MTLTLDRDRRLAIGPTPEPASPRAPLGPVVLSRCAGCGAVDEPVFVVPRAGRLRRLLPLCGRCRSRRNQTILEFFRRARAA